MDITMTSSRSSLRRASCLAFSICMFGSSALAAPLTFTVTMTEPVAVTGTPRLALNIGGVTRYGDYTADSALPPNQLKFVYGIQAGDFDANGIVVTPTLDLNGGTIRDNAGNDIGSTSFTPPDMSGIKIQTYRVAFAAGTYTTATANAVSFTIEKAPANGSYSYSITSSGTGSGTVTGNGTFTGPTVNVSGVDVSSLPPGNLTLAISLLVTGQGTGSPVQATALLDNQAPSGYSASIDATAGYVNAANISAASVRILGGETGATYTYTLSGPSGTPVTGSGTINADPQQITGLNLSGLGDGTLTLQVALTDTLNNIGPTVTASAVKDTVAPTFGTVAVNPTSGTLDDL